MEAPEEGIRGIQSRLASLTRDSRGTTWVLLATTAGIIGFFSYLGAFASREVVLALVLMAGSLVFRIALEVYGRRRLGRMDPTLPSSEFQDRLHRYYAHRRWVHVVATPVVLILYGLGFVILLPDFRQSLSPGFYTYILISGAAFALGLFWLILSQVRREFRMLRELRPVPSETSD